MSIELFVHAANEGMTSWDIVNVIIWKKYYW